MKLGVLANCYGKLTLDEALAKFAALGIEAVEIGAGGYPKKAHCDPAVLLNNEDEYNKFMATFKKYGIEPCALAAHGNPVHPNKTIAAEFESDFRNAVLLAEKMGLDTVITFSGCPGDHDGAKLPNWVTCAWPNDFGEVLEYQWNEVLIPYWKEEVKFANAHGVTKIALEMHPGFCVYNPATLLRLREAVGPTIGANFDPSHLFWQGIDPIAAIRELRGAIYHVHAKDTKIDDINTARNGVLDTKSFKDEPNRAWIFRSIGFGHDLGTWKAICSELRLAGYDKVMSIEHEDSLMSIDEGLAKAVEALSQCIIREPMPRTISWA